VSGGREKKVAEIFRRIINRRLRGPAYLSVGDE
jgi:hypothetical protein